MTASYGTPNYNWLAVQTWPRYEKKVAAELHRKQISNYLPLFFEQHQWSDRNKKVKLPLFPGYVFVNISEQGEQRLSVLRSSGVVGFVGTRGKGTPVSEAEIESIRILIEDGCPLQNCAFLSVGQRVRITSGSLSGIEGILVEKKSDLNLVVSVEIIQRSIAVRVDGYEVEAA